MNDSLPTLGWDVGGAHLKAVLVGADGRALQALQQPCPLWRGLEPLERAIASVMSALGKTRMRHAVTMTGELADIFPSRVNGVMQLAQCMTARLGSNEVKLYAGRKGFIAPSAAGTHAADIASANWHASAAFLATQVENGLFIDIGSTTADLIPLHHGHPAARGYADAERMRFDELVYTGVVRTPVIAVAQRIPFDGEWQGMAAEHFATMADVYRLTGDLPESYDMAETADGAGKTPEDSARRLARMVGRDLADAPMGQWRCLANTIKSRQMSLLQSAAERAFSRHVLDGDAPLIGAGAGYFLLRELARRLDRKYLDASTLLSSTPEAADWTGVCLPAFAVAWLAREAECHP
jgi:(4-(4-[2-(gamma-L-glutamylamino)ethyl]phenoxymethyl)furan-2-yl)methanamine synthase